MSFSTFLCSAGMLVRGERRDFDSASGGIQLKSPRRARREANEHMQIVVNAPPPLVLVAVALSLKSESARVARTHDGEPGAYVTARARVFPQKKKDFPLFMFTIHAASECV
jgi:hypothetical protein